MLSNYLGMKMTDRISEAIAADGRSNRALALATGLAEGSIRRMRAGDANPRADSILRICAAVGRSPDDLLGYKVQSVDSDADAMRTRIGLEADILAQMLVDQARSRLERGPRPDIDRVLDWWAACGGALDDDDPLFHFTDVYALPSSSDDLPHPQSMGRDSLASSAFGFRDTDKLAALLEGLPKPQTDGIIEAHIGAYDRGQPVLTQEKIRVTVGDGVEINEGYYRLLLPVRTRDRRDMTLCFCRLTNRRPRAG